MAPELETLDQLLGGDLPPAVIRGLFETDDRFARAIAAMLRDAEVRLRVDGVDVPRRRWREVLAAACTPSGPTGARLEITDAGVRRIA
jgi:hypothetical protein